MCGVCVCVCGVCVCVCVCVMCVPVCCTWSVISELMLIIITLI